MAVYGIEPVIAGLVKRLEDELPAAIDDVNADQTDGILIDRAHLQVLDHVPHILTLHQWPTIGVAEGPGRYEDDTGHEATGVHELQIVAFMQDADLQTLAKKLRRIFVAVERVALAGRVIPHATLGGVNAAWGVQRLRRLPGPTLGEEDPGSVVTWMSSVSLVLLARTDEYG